MELVNRTRFPALLYRNAIDDDTIAAAVVARVTYAMKGTLTPAVEQPWIVSPEPWDGPQGPMEGDLVFYRGGVDLFVFGLARPEGRFPVARMDVTVAAGSFRRSVVVFGDRKWLRDGKNLAPSDPKPFRKMPLTPANAYGGKTAFDGIEVTHPDNPTGKGLYASAEEAEGKPLPNLEEPDQLIRSWDDKPDPAGLGPCAPFGGLRIRNGLEFAEDWSVKTMKPELFNAAFPRMIAPSVAPGDRIELTGVSSKGPVHVTVPQSPLAVRLTFGEETSEQPLAVDQVGIEVEERRAFITYRFPFRYVVQARQQRRCELVPRAAPVEDAARPEGSSPSAAKD